MGPETLNLFYTDEYVYNGFAYYVAFCSVAMEPFTCISIRS